MRISDARPFRQEAYFGYYEGSVVYADVSGRQHTAMGMESTLSK